MTHRRLRRVHSLALAVLLAAACAKPAPLSQPGDARFTGAAPDSFDVEVLTTKGPMTVRVRRDWSPNGADRVYALVRNHFYDGLPFFRVVRGFVAQVGLPVDTAVAAAWRTRTIPDDSVRTPNRRGTVSFARQAPGTRTTQLFFNLGDNAALDRLDGVGYAPVGRVTEGMPVLDALESEYSGTAGRELPGPSQDSIRAQGDAYLLRAFPRLDRIERARVVATWR